MSPRTKKQFEELREERRSQIMDVALGHFASEGYHSTTISHIARHAGISKGLLYNYFDSKETLLRDILQRSMAQIYSDFDIDRDGYLSEDEFEYFVRRISIILREKKEFWRLLFQLLMQNEVRDEFLNRFLKPDALIRPASGEEKGLFFSDLLEIISDYFIRKGMRMNPGYDPYIEMNMFVISLKGFAVTYIWANTEDDEIYEKTIDRIIAQFK